MKNKFKRISAFVFAFIMMLSVVNIPVGAVAEKDKAQVKITSSETAPEKGQVFTVGAEITNYATMTPQISAMELTVKFDTNVFEFVPDSIEKNSLKVNSGDVVAVNFDGVDSVTFYYCYANSSGKALPRKDTSKFVLFRFKLKVKDDLAEDTRGKVEVTNCNMYDSHTTSTGNKITCKNPVNLSLKAYVERPDLLFNESGTNESTYDKMVKIEFGVPTAKITYNGGDEKTVQSPYYAKENGTYTISVKIDGKTKTEKFTVAREIQSISMKTGTYTKEYALGEMLDLSEGEIIVQYKDASPYSDEKGISYIPLSNEDVSITGFDNTKSGEQALIVEYQGFKTTMTVRIKDVSVYSAILKPGSTLKYRYTPVGFPVDITGVMIIVTYSDGTQEERKVGASMLTPYSMDIEGARSIGIQVTQDIVISNAFTTEYISADELNDFRETVFEIDVNNLTANDIPMIGELQNKYNTLLAQFGPSVFTDVYGKYTSVVERLDEFTATDTTTPETNDSSAETNTVTTTPTDSSGNVNTMKIVGYIVASIVVISVLVGAFYFIIVYMKKKREEEEDELYYDDYGDDDDDFENENVTFNFDDEEIGAMEFEEASDNSETFIAPSSKVITFNFDDDLSIDEDDTSNDSNDDLNDDIKA